MQQTASALSEVHAGALHPLNQSELKSVGEILSDIGATHPAIADMLETMTPLHEFVAAALSLSPHLRDIAARDPEILVLAIGQPLKPLLTGLVDAARDAWKPQADGTVPTEGQVMTRLRIAKRRVSFLLAMADLARIFDAAHTTEWLTAIADASVSAAINHLLLSADDAGKVTLPDRGEPSRGSGLIVLGMGKHGARELNYSSDIDIVVFFDPQAGILPDPDDGLEIYGRMMRRLVRIMQERTGDGYVFRTDLRLRPDPGSTPLAVPVEAALLYYEGRGQNWERAAFIKARPVAGDLEAGAAFLKEMTPFVFRKYLDYAAIADIHAIKRQIHAHKGHGTIAVKGHNVKLGRGGIREIEFFAQTQQLIAGGRMPELRTRSTEAALKALNAANWVDDATTRELIVCYWFLRDVEHRIQMVHDEQTHLLPLTEPELRRIALMSGFADTASFSSELETVLKTVEKRYARLFEKEEGLSGTEGNLVFTGQNDDPDTLKTLAKLGFDRPEDMSRVIRTWHYGRYRATQSVEARERLTELIPLLLKAFGESRRADEALMRFDTFLAGLPAGIQLFSLLGNNPPLLKLTVNIMSAAPRLAEIIAKRPHVFDGMLDPALMAQLPTRDYLAHRLESFTAGRVHYEEFLDQLRIFAAEHRFLIGIRLLTGSINGTQAGRAFADLASLVIGAALDVVRKEMDRAHGVYPGGRVALAGMGKLGSFELTAGSDVDLILLYDYDAEVVESVGDKPLDAVRYFTRLTQRLISALSAPMAEGVLYEVDMRLRPSGNKGPVATRLNAFERYQKDEAWTWEHMALSRARMMAGDDDLIERAQAIISDVMGEVRNEKKIAADVKEMRTLIGKEKPPRDIWDFKLIPGGLIDIEFITQFLTLVGPARGVTVATSGLSTAQALTVLGKSLMDRNDLETCLAALTLFTDLSQIIRLCIDGPFDADDIPAGLADLLCRAADCPDMKTLEAEVKRLSKAVRKVFDKVVRPS